MLVIGREIMILFLASLYHPSRTEGDKIKQKLYSFNVCLIGGICLWSSEDNSGMLSFSLQLLHFLFALVFPPATWVYLYLLTYRDPWKPNDFKLVKCHICLVPMI